VTSATVNSITVNFKQGFDHSEFWICFWTAGEFAGVPPFALAAGELDRVEGEDDGFSVFLTDDFDAVGGAVFGAHVGGKTVANASPTGFFATPFDAATGVGQLLTIVQAAARADDPVGKVTARALEKVACG
jgi:hypothetical protein